ncbi:MAG TPA: hypothetical protein EYP41_22470 [Anaerolineae bacterium]|nr:hypothetical protein [Anaerolineae bacterium]HIP68892.1 hypothetical protein [Chromatiales bacterium]
MKHATQNNTEKTGRTVSIMIDSKATRFDFDQLKHFHKGDSWFGCAVGFRVMQLAARELSGKTLWSRKQLSVLSGHPGAGVRDAIEMIGASVSNNRFQLLDETNNQGCNRNMKFEWWLKHGDDSLHIKLKDGFVPEQFFTLLDRLSHNNENNEDKKEFDQMKHDLSNNLWQQPLDALFEFDFAPAQPTPKTA